MTVVFYIPPECKIKQEIQGFEIPRHFLKCPNTKFSKFVKSIGGGDRDRTCDLLNANQMLSQLSYAPKNLNSFGWEFLYNQALSLLKNFFKSKELSLE